MLRRCLRNTTQHHNILHSSARIHHVTFSCSRTGRQRDSQSFTRSKHQSTSKHHSNSFRRLHGRYLTPENYLRGRFMTTRNASTSGTANAAYTAEKAAKELRQKQIIQLVEKKVGQRAKLVEESLHSENATEAGSTSQLSKIQVSKLLKDLEPLLEPWNRYTSLNASLASTAPLLKDPDDALRSLAEDEISGIKAEMDELAEKMRWLLLKRETSGMENVGAMVEIKAGAGGEEAALFVGELMRMYLRYADIWGEEISSRGGEGDSEWRGGGGWKTSMVSESVSATSTGRTRFKEVTFEVKGRGAYETFRWETGVHRVQRVPLTETSGRMHTSAVAVVVLPVTEESNAGNDDISNFYVDEKEVKVEVMRARGAGGQHVNKTESAVRLTHLPTGINVSMQDSRSQHTNKQYAWKILRSRLFDLKLRQDAERHRDTRRTLIRGMDRSDKIRTYNYVQDRVTDHRTGFTTMNLDNVMDGEGLEAVIEACRRGHEEEVLAGLLLDEK